MKFLKLRNILSLSFLVFRFLVFAQLKERPFFFVVDQFRTRFSAPQLVYACKNHTFYQEHFAEYDQ